ncbi:MAG TPA: GDCCVxC domain-containing (seleno)protein [Sinorhizobium sp.]|nr:GDCCVxC domain-containing (seleno)protein [Sinorhizobium sp.]
MQWRSREAPRMTELISILVCPACGHRSAETMPTDACLYSYACKGCGLLIRPKEGDCCVFCSYGSLPCPPMQEERARRQVSDRRR